MSVENRPTDAFELAYPVIVVGGGACGMCAALAARDGGAEVLLIERDKTPLGTTAMSTGLIPAAGTPEQTARGVDDSPVRFASDIMAKAKNVPDEAVVKALAETSAETVAWLRGTHSAPIDLIDGFLYPGHTAMRMYGTPNRSGAELMAALEGAAAEAGVDILTEALVTDLFTDGDRVTGVAIERPDGAREEIGCEALILACCGFAGAEELVEKYIPEIKDGVFHGHPGNKGDAVKWGEALGAALGDMDAYQGHGGLAAGHGVPILWPTIMEGGIQINRKGERFSDESKGYSEQAVNVLQQPDGVAWTVFDERLRTLMLAFDDYQQAEQAGAVKKADNLETLADHIGAPIGAVTATLNAERAAKIGEAVDPFGRDFKGKAPLEAPYYSARVTGALFHTQGGLEVDAEARVKKAAGGVFPNLFAGGGAARGVSGAGASGYIAGNGLLTATSLGKLAGRAAAGQVAG